MALAKLMTQEGQLMKMRALGYSQEEIASKLGISQSAVSQRIKTIRKRARHTRNDDNAFWELLVGAGVAILLLRILEERR